MEPVNKTNFSLTDFSLLRTQTTTVGVPERHTKSVFKKVETNGNRTVGVLLCRKSVFFNKGLSCKI